jgi:hypothetical protein
LTLRVVHEIQIHELFQLQIVRLHTVHNVGEQCTTSV